MYCYHKVRDQMTEFPFPLSVRRYLPEGGEETLICTALLRTIPRTRAVYEALWNDREIILKIFSKKIRAKRHLKREWRGLTRLQKLDLNAPIPLFCGRTKDGRLAVAVEKIVESSTVLEVFNKTFEDSKKFDLLILVCKEIAKQHNKGVVQTDSHLDNFLMRDERVFALDPGQMKFFSRPILREKGLSQIAAIACYLPDDDTEAIPRLCAEYIQARGWYVEKSDEDLLRKQRDLHRKRTIRKALKKTLRTSKRYLHIKGDGYLAVLEKDFCHGADPGDLIDQIDLLMDAGNIFKDGNTCYVSRFKWNGKYVVAKRYNHKSLIHSVRHTIKKSRARKGWLHGHRLLALNIATPKPLAYIEHRKGPLVWRSYLITEYAEGQRLFDLLQDNKITEEQRLKTIQKVVELIHKMGKYGITHGDLKHSNILVLNNGPVLTDLDGMTVHRWKKTFEIKKADDIERLLRNSTVPF